MGDVIGLDTAASRQCSRRLSHNGVMPQKMEIAGMEKAMHRIAKATQR
jgi:hypothetical protein